MALDLPIIVGNTQHSKQRDFGYMSGLIERLHKEDIKAAIRKRYRSLAAFERANFLGEQSVTDVLRGGSNRRTRSAIERLLREDAEISAQAVHIIPANSETAAPAHRLNAGAR